MVIRMRRLPHSRSGRPLAIAAAPVPTRTPSLLVLAWAENVPTGDAQIVLDDNEWLALRQRELRHRAQAETYEAEAEATEQQMLENKDRAD
jgi:hypothetical protein